MFLKIHYKYGGWVAITVGKLRTVLGHREAPTVTTITGLVGKLEEAKDQSRTLKAPGANDLSGRTVELRHVARDSVDASLGESVRAAVLKRWS